MACCRDVDVEADGGGQTGRLALRVGEFDADQQLGGGDRGECEVGVVRQNRRGDRLAAFDRDQHTGVEDQSLHGSAAVA